MEVTTTSLDAALASAVDVARAAVLEVAPAEHVGAHIEVVLDGDLVVTHLFQCQATAYRGWRWAATLTRTPLTDQVTVDEVVLLPGPGSLLAPEWLPWDARVRPGDLGPGDLHPTALDDPRLEPGFFGSDALEATDETASDEAPLRPEQWQLGLGREVVLSSYGRGIAADRWNDGEFGPEAAMAKAAPAHCGTCGFLMPIGGLVGQAFGVCANAIGADGRVVAFDYGCGAHSSVREIEGTGVPVTEIAVDDSAVELVDLRGGPVVDDLADDLVEPLVDVEEGAADSDLVASDGADGAAKAEAVTRDAGSSESAADGARENAGQQDAATEAADGPHGRLRVIAAQPVESIDLEVGGDGIRVSESEEIVDDDLADEVGVADADVDDAAGLDADFDDDDEDDDDEDEDDEDDEDEDDEDDEDDDEDVVVELDDVDDIEPDEIL